MWTLLAKVYFCRLLLFSISFDFFVIVYLACLYVISAYSPRCYEIEKAVISIIVSPFSV